MRIVVGALLLAAALQGGAVKPLTPAGREFAIPEVSDRVGGCSAPDSVMARLNVRPLHFLEGVWQFGADGGTICVERPGVGGALVFDLRAVAAANRAVAPGTLMGRVAATADPDLFSGMIYTRLHEDGSLSKPVEVTLHLDRTSAYFKLRPVQKKWRLNLYRLIPYMFRMGVSYRDDTPIDLTGCTRIMPPSPMPLVPVSL